MRLPIRSYTPRAVIEARLRNQLRETIERGLEEMAARGEVVFVPDHTKVVMAPVGGRPPKAGRAEFTTWLAGQPLPLKTRSKRAAMERFGISDRTLRRWLAETNNR